MFPNTAVLCRPSSALRESLNVFYIFRARKQGIRGSGSEASPYN